MLTHMVSTPALTTGITDHAKSYPGAIRSSGVEWRRRASTRSAGCGKHDQRRPGVARLDVDQGCDHCPDCSPERLQTQAIILPMTLTLERSWSGEATDGR